MAIELNYQYLDRFTKLTAVADFILFQAVHNGIRGIKTVPHRYTDYAIVFWFEKSFRYYSFVNGWKTYGGHWEAQKSGIELLKFVSRDTNTDFTLNSPEQMTLIFREWAMLNGYWVGKELSQVTHYTKLTKSHAEAIVRLLDRAYRRFELSYGFYAEPMWQNVDMMNLDHYEAEITFRGQFMTEWGFTERLKRHFNISMEDY